MEKDQAYSSVSLVRAGIVFVAVETGAVVVAWACVWWSARTTVNAMKAMGRIVQPPRAIVSPTRTPPRTSMEMPVSHGRCPIHFP